MDTQLMNNSELHLENVEWNKMLKMWRQEIISLQDKLSEVVNTRTEKEFLIELAELENNCIIHKEKINKLQDRIKTEDLGYLRNIKEHNEIASETDIELHNQIKERFDTEFDMFAELKKDFDTFFAKYNIN